MASKKKVVGKLRKLQKQTARTIELLSKMELGKIYKFRTKEWTYSEKDKDFTSQGATHYGVIRTFNETSVRVQGIVSNSRRLKKDNQYRKIKHHDYFTISYPLIISVDAVDENELFADLPLHMGESVFPLMQQALEKGTFR